MNNHGLNTLLDPRSLPPRFWQRSPAGCLETTRTRAGELNHHVEDTMGKGRVALAGTNPSLWLIKRFHYSMRWPNPQRYSLHCNWWDSGLVTLLLSNLSDINLCLMAIILFIRNERKFWYFQTTTCITWLPLLTQTVGHPTGAPYLAGTWKGAGKKSHKLKEGLPPPLPMEYKCGPSCSITKELWPSNYSLLPQSYPHVSSSQQDTGKFHIESC